MCHSGVIDFYDGKYVYAFRLEEIDRTSDDQYWLFKVKLKTEDGHPTRSSIGTI